MNPAAAARFVLVVCFLVLLFNSGARFVIGLLLYPMANDLQWSRSTLSLCVTVFMVLLACALPLVGSSVDRFGARAVLGVAVLVSALGLVGMGLIESPWQALLLYGVVFALGSAGTSITPIGVLLSRWYPQRMGMANSIAISGMGVGQFLIISVLAGPLAHLGLAWLLSRTRGRHPGVCPAPRVDCPAWRATLRRSRAPRYDRGGR